MDQTIPRSVAALGIVGAALSHVALADSPLPRVPDGFTVEKVAAAPLVQHPMMACFDERGRLYVCESAGTNRPAKELIADPQDKILMLEDTDGDGVFDKSTVFADKMVFPQGCLWYRGALYTCSSPYLWKLEDTDDDGVCDQRTVLVKSFGFSGNAADIHGPFLSPDGRLYWCDGRHGHEIRDLGDGEFGGENNVTEIPPKPEPGLPNPEGSLLTMGKAARIFSCRPDGSDVRVLCGGGMDNPVEVDFWETGECLGTVNLFYGQPRGDCLVHWVDGGVYPRYDQQDCIAEFKSTGELLTEVHNYGHVAVSGMCRYRSGEFFRESDPDASSVRATVPDSGQFFITQFNTHKVVLTTLERDGATFRHAATEDFLVSDDPDFHPTDVLEDADGSLLVIDTGGWFRIGCPTSQTAKPEIAGAIYRVRRADAHNLHDARGQEIAWESVVSDPPALAGLLDDPRPAVREHAVDTIALAIDQDEAGQFEKQIVDHVYYAQPARLSVPLLWALARAEGSIWALRRYAEVGSEARQRMIACQIAARRGVPEAYLAIVKAINGSTSEECRAALEAIGTHHLRDRRAPAMQAAVDAIVVRLGRSGLDRITEHAAINALIRIGAPELIAPALSHRSPRVSGAALLALEQIDAASLTREHVLPLLGTPDPALQARVLELISRREGWAAATLDLLSGWIFDPELPAEKQAILRGFLTARAGEPEVQGLVTAALRDPGLPSAARRTLLEVMGGAHFDEYPPAWTEALELVLAGDDPDSRLEAVRVAAVQGIDQFDGQLLAIAQDELQPPVLRVDAFAALAPRLPDVAPPLFDFLTARLTNPDATIVDRLRVAGALAQSPLDDHQLGRVNDALDRVGPAVATALLPVYERSTSDKVGRRLVTQLLPMAGSLTVTAGELERLFAGYSASVRSEAEPLLAAIRERGAGQAKKLEELASQMAEGVADRGREVFFGRKAACGSCHRIGSEGAPVGPDLSKIGAIRQPRDLLESIIFPSASFARGYEPYAVVTDDGRVANGNISRETSDEIVLRTTDLSEVRIRRDNVEEMQQSQTSIMPQGLETRLSAEELQDLLAYLQTLR